MDIKENEKITKKYVANIDGKKCIGCGGCKRRCKFGAIFIGKEYYIIDEEKCTGCKVCVEVCPAEAISYESR